MAANALDALRKSKPITVNESKPSRGLRGAGTRRALNKRWGKICGKWWRTNTRTANVSGARGVCPGCREGPAASRCPAPRRSRAGGPGHPHAGGHLPWHLAERGCFPGTKPRVPRAGASACGEAEDGPFDGRGGLLSAWLILAPAPAAWQLLLQGWGERAREVLPLLMQRLVGWKILQCSTAS